MEVFACEVGKYIVIVEYIKIIQNRVFAFKMRNERASLKMNCYLQRDINTHLQSIQ